MADTTEMLHLQMLGNTYVHVSKLACHVRVMCLQHGTILWWLCLETARFIPASQYIHFTMHLRFTLLFGMPGCRLKAALKHVMC